MSMTASGPRHRRHTHAEVQVGSDGLTHAERTELSAEFRRTMGAKPADTQEFRDLMDRIADKLAHND